MRLDLTVLAALWLRWHVTEVSAAGDQQLHPSLLVDVKHWLAGTELARAANWQHAIKPCTLAGQRVRIDEPAVLELAHSLDAGAPLDSALDELWLAADGLLLLPPAEPDAHGQAQLAYLNQSADCWTGDTLPPADGERLFHFQPHPDQLSWFNPENWASALHGQLAEHLVPDSHRIPCAEDVVIFGNPQGHLGGLTVSAADAVPFKVNFRSAAAPNSSDAQSIGSVRVSKLLIGDQAYDNARFKQLVSSQTFDNILFQFRDQLSLLSQTSGLPGLVVDDSSIESEDNLDVCKDEAGCLCGNEAPDVMRAICSFGEPLLPHELPCWDPIDSKGYCDPVCASVVSINFDPAKFSERWLLHTLLLTTNETTDHQDQLLADSVFTGARRTHLNRYEIMFRPVFGQPELGPEAQPDYSSAGREQQMAAKFMHKLDTGGKKAVYGIRSVVVKSSVKWRTNNRALIFWPSFVVSLVLFTAISTIQDKSYGLIQGGGGSGFTSNAQTLWANLRPYLTLRSASRANISSFASDRNLLDDSASVADIPLDPLYSDVEYGRS